MLGIVWLSGIRLLPWREEEFLMPVNEPGGDVVLEEIPDGKRNEITV